LQLLCQQPVMPTRSPAVDRDRLLTQAVAQKHGALRYFTFKTMHNMQSIELDKRTHNMKTATQEGRKSCWAAMQYTVAPMLWMYHMLP